MAHSPEIASQYGTALTAGGILFRADRGLIEVRGKDRATWLNNLVTNVVKTLQPGEGNYAFATNVKGRVVFDVNILVLEQCLWLDLDLRLVEKATKHLERFIITEDVQLGDLTASSERIAIMGPQAAEPAGRLGLGNFGAMSQLQHVTGQIGGTEARLVRHDFAGLPALEITVLGEGRATARSALKGVADELRFATLSDEAVRMLRMEAGIPASVEDIDDDVVPPETGQVERGISYHKGCYLGQEVIERMRSHGVLARKFVGIRVEGETPLERGAEVWAESVTVGRITSSCVSVGLGAVLCLGYLKSAHSTTGTRVRVISKGIEHDGVIVSLPARSLRG
jgi:folate-binding protein YgfZ